MKKNLLLSILAVVPAALMPLAGYGQAAPAEKAEATPKYEIFAGYGYTSLNQVNQSRHGLQGVNASVTRDMGKYFGITADGAYYQWELGSSGTNSAGVYQGNPGDPTVSEVFLGPVLHANLYGHVDGFIHGLLGGVHTGGESMTPKVAFGGGFGGGLDYRLSPHFSLRASGDAILSAFSLRNNSTQAGNSPHTTRNPRATFGVVYKF